MDTQLHCTHPSVTRERYLLWHMLFWGYVNTVSHKNGSSVVNTVLTNFLWGRKGSSKWCQVMSSAGVCLMHGEKEGGQEGKGREREREKSEGQRRDRKCWETLCPSFTFTPTDNTIKNCVPWYFKQLCGHEQFVWVSQGTPKCIFVHPIYLIRHWHMFLCTHQQIQHHWNRHTKSQSIKERKRSKPPTLFLCTYQKGSQ